MFIVAFSFYLIAQFLFCDANPIIGGLPAGKIISKYGNEKELTGRTDYPYMVYLEICEAISENKNGNVNELKCSHCGGVIIRKRAVLTAAHCLTGTLTEPTVFIYAGIMHLDIELLKAEEGLMKDYLIHEDYINEAGDFWSLSYQHNDIAIVWVQKGFCFNKEINQIPLGSPYTKIENKNGLILGWGFDNTGKDSLMLLKGEIRVISRELCAQSYLFNEFTDGMICAISDTKTTTSCKGDSGGPLVVNGKLFGLISFNMLRNVTLKTNEVVEICDAKQPAVLTYVAKYQQWIEDNLCRGPPKYRKPKPIGARLC